MEQTYDEPINIDNDNMLNKLSREYNIGDKDPYPYQVYMLDNVTTGKAIAPEENIIYGYIRKDGNDKYLTFTDINGDQYAVAFLPNSFANHQVVLVSSLDLTDDIINIKPINNFDVELVNTFFTFIDREDVGRELRNETLVRITAYQ